VITTANDNELDRDFSRGSDEEEGGGTRKKAGILRSQRAHQPNSKFKFEHGYWMEDACIDSGRTVEPCSSPVRLFYVVVLFRIFSLKLEGF
jgi:hypothetical protein